MMGPGMNLVTTVIGFGMSATFIVFVCTRLICGRIRPVESRPEFEMDSTTDLEQSEPRVRGLEPVVVAAIPTMKFNREAFDSVEDAQCTICLGEYQDKEVLRIIPKCGHNFHLACIDLWLQKQSTCPVCRLPLQELFETKHASLPMHSMILQSMGGSDVVSNHSHQWLLPGRERSLGDVSNQGRHESSGNLEPTITGEAETGR
ncbi:hypothetical protein HHK36_028851 [Tetracentron sinense]|uniref:RING-type domain-containing protein n=1 Tax=Tetracentron sinense TaxID=13715 RepID=A0A834YC64_TETSI|nr:hypothetical protein HHK36_028851 [Tetracentron sinense]